MFVGAIVDQPPFQTSEAIDRPDFSAADRGLFHVFTVKIMFGANGAKCESLKIGKMIFAARQATIERKRRCGLSMFARGADHQYFALPARKNAEARIFIARHSIQNFGCFCGGDHRSSPPRGFKGSGFKDVTAVGEAVEERGRHFGVAEDGGPFAEAEVGGDDDAGALVKLAQQVEQQRPA